MIGKGVASSYDKRRGKGGGVVKTIKQFIKEEDAIGIVEIILILVILIAIVAIFREQIGNIVKNAFEKINSNADNSMKDIEVSKPK